MNLATDTADLRMVALYRATFGRWLYPVADGVAPLGLHWCLFPPMAATEALSADGHPPRAQAMDVNSFPRRMWVGGELAIVAPLPIGRPVERRSNDRPVEIKEGRAGRMALTGVDHGWTIDGAPLLTERQDVAYRAAATQIASGAPIAKTPWQPEGDLVWNVPTSTTLLFRYSALTFNSHRIHYDTPYTCEVERYPDLLVHGPLQATILLNLAATLLKHVPTHFSYRAVAPLFASDGLIAIGVLTKGGAHCAVYGRDGRTRTMASAS